MKNASAFFALMLLLVNGCGYFNPYAATRLSEPPRTSFANYFTMIGTIISSSVAIDIPNAAAQYQSGHLIGVGGVVIEIRDIDNTSIASTGMHIGTNPLITTGANLDVVSDGIEIMVLSQAIMDAYGWYGMMASAGALNVELYEENYFKGTYSISSGADFTVSGSIDVYLSDLAE